MADFIREDKSIPKGARVAAEFGQVAVDMVSRLPTAIEVGTSIGAAIGSIIPGLGTVIGGFIGSWLGILAATLSSAVPHGMHINDILNNEDDPQNTVQTAVQRPQSLIQTATNPLVDTKGTAREMVNAMANGATIRGVMNYYGQNMMQQAMYHGNITSVSNRLAAAQGFSTITASAFADHTNRVMLGKAGGFTSSSRNTVYDQVYGVANATGIQMLYQKQVQASGSM